MKKITTLIALLFICTACVAPAHNNGPSPEHGFGSAFRGLAHLILSPIQIAAGLLEGIASVPYYMATGVNQINQGMIEAQSKVTLDDTYESAYGKRLSQVPDNGDTGEVFRRMKHASQYLQKVLKNYGVHDAERYILTSIDTANEQNYTLFAVIYRPQDTIEVIDKYDNRTVRHFQKSDRLFYEPFRQDTSGTALDRIIDWAALPKDALQNQKAQAVMLSLAANAVVENKQREDYWQAEQRWIAGEFRQVAEEQATGVRKRLEI